MSPFEEPPMESVVVPLTISCLPLRSIRPELVTGRRVCGLPRVSVPAVTLTEGFDWRLMVPAQVLAPAAFRRAPVLCGPVPFRLSRAVTPLRPPDISIAPPALPVAVPEPRAV